MDTKKQNVPRIALLGVCDRAKYERGDPPILSRINILGLRKTVLAYFFPFDLSGLWLALAVYGIEQEKPGPVVLRDRSGNQLYRIDITTTEEVDITKMNQGDKQGNDKGVFVQIGAMPSWTVFLAPLHDTVLNEPQILEAFLLEDAGEIPLGMISFGLAGAPPLTPDRIAAIKSDPRAVKEVRLNLGCKFCETKLKVFAALKRPDKIEDDLVWYQDLPEKFICGCKKTNMNLEILRNNMHAILGQVDVTSKNVSISTLYEHRNIDQISKKFLKVITESKKEEEIQKFLSENPIIFHFLSPLRIFKKPPILTKHQADFAILDSLGTLFLIEIERANILLLRKDGATSAEMEHAISQVRDWLFLYEKHRGAVLECLDIADREVTKGLRKNKFTFLMEQLSSSNSVVMYNVSGQYVSFAGQRFLIPFGIACL